MITHLSVKNFAIIKDLSLDLREGLNIITGETGAGKSIIIEALSMGLGARADSAFVRTGSERAVIQLVLEADGEEVILTREILASGRSTCKINDDLVTVGRLNDFCAGLVDLHGQYDNQALLNPDNHISILDSFDGDGSISSALSAYREAFSDFTAARSELGDLRRRISENKRKKDFMEFEVSEIKKYNPTIGEDRELEARLAVSRNRERILSAASSAYTALYESDESCTALLSAAATEIEKISDLSPDLKEILETVREASCSLEEAARGLYPYTNQDETTLDNTDRIIERLESLNYLKEKFGGSIEAVIEHKTRLENELSEIEGFDGLEERARRRTADAYDRAEALAFALRKKREAAAEVLSEEVNRELGDLSFKNAFFRVFFSEADKKKDRYVLTENGIDRAEFYISTNKGESLKPLAKIASGGEISRIMLAFKKILGDYSQVPTFIFDEIDTGISGRAASVVGVKLSEIAKNRQVICITHLPQIAVMGDAHYLIEKTSDEKETFTRLTLMDRDTLLTEVARLSGSSGLSPSAIANAKEMLEEAEKRKKTIK